MAASMRLGGVGTWQIGHIAGRTLRMHLTWSDPQERALDDMAYLRLCGPSFRMFALLLLRVTYTFDGDLRGCSHEICCEAELPALAMSRRVFWKRNG